MHTRIMKFVLDISTVVAVIASIAAGIFAGAVALEVEDGFVLAFIAFILVDVVVFIIFETKIAMMGMQVEQAENIRKMAKDTQMIFQAIHRIENTVQNNPGSGMSIPECASVQGSAVSQSGNIGYKTIQPNRQFAGPSKWVCKKCLEENGAYDKFCSVCGSKKTY